jgi:hypothetical protein
VLLAKTGFRVKIFVMSKIDDGIVEYRNIIVLLKAAKRLNNNNDIVRIII